MKLFSGTAYLFKYNHHNLPDSNVKIMAAVCDVFPEVNHLRLLKESFERIYEAKSREEAEKLYRQWEKLVPGTGANQIAAWTAKYQMDAELFAEFRSLRNTMKRWHEYIFNYFDKGCQVTNAATEGLNRLVDSLNRLGNGYGFKRLRARVLFCHEAAPMTRYTAKKLKRAVRTNSSGLPLQSPTSFSFVTFPEHTTSISIEPDEVIPVLKPVTVFNCMKHPIFCE